MPMQGSDGGGWRVVQSRPGYLGILARRGKLNKVILREGNRLNGVCDRVSR
jgi:hypothetical protein